MTDSYSSVEYLGAGQGVIHVLQAQSGLGSVDSVVWTQLAHGESKMQVVDLELPTLLWGAVCDLDGDGRDDLMFSAGELGIFTGFVANGEDAARAHLWLSPDLPHYKHWQWRLLCTPSPRAAGLTDLVIQDGWDAFHVENRSE